MIITLLTDFGLEDGYVASMKGVILSISPRARLVDVSHLVPPQDVRAGAFLLRSVYRSFPPGTVHLAVVDPGVGTDRRGLAIQARDCFFVGPDNGIFSLALAEIPAWEARSLENPRYRRPEVSMTFHGRDVFAPAAAHLANGAPFDSMGPLCTPLSPGWAPVRKSADELEGEVIYIDHFGNAITNLGRIDLEGLAARDRWVVRAGLTTLPSIAGTYAEVEEGSPLALIGSTDLLEISINRGSAAKTLGLRPGTVVTVRTHGTRPQTSTP